MVIESHDGGKIDSVSTYLSTSFAGFYENTPRYHGEAMSRASERVE